MKVLIFLILTLLLLLISKSAFEKISQKLYNGDKWGKYRIGDVVLREITSVHYKPEFYDNVLYHYTEFPGSIANEYINKNKDSGIVNNLPLLKEIINSRPNKFNYDYNVTLFLHIRSGDVICNDLWKDKIDHYSKVGNIKWWDSLIDYIKNNSINKVVILSGTHFNECLEESEKYILDREKFIKEKTDLVVDYRLGQSPDDDIILISKAKHFISTGGGYGKLLESLIN